MSPLIIGQSIAPLPLRQWPPVSCLFARIALPLPNRETPNRYCFILCFLSLLPRGDCGWRFDGFGRGLGKAMCNIIPIDNRPYGLEVVRTQILVLQVVGVLPNVNPQERNKTAMGQQWILVRCGSELDTFSCRIVSEPGPSTTLDSSGMRIEEDLKILKAAEFMLR